MKKLLAILLLAAMVFTLAACGGNSTTPAAPEANAPGTEAPAADAPEVEAPAEEAPADEPAEAPATGGEYKLGMGIVLNMDSSSAGNAQVDATVAAVVTDAEGKIVMARIDCVQDKMDVTDGEVDTEKTFETKAELLDRYNMVAYSDATLEWYEQAQNFEAYVVGKTAAEVEGTETVLNDEGHTVAVDETLYASVSISIEDFIGAIVKACNDEQGQTFTADGAFTLGLAAISSADESTPATEDEDGVVKMYSAYGAAVVDADGKIVAALNDATQPNITIDIDGEIVDTSFRATKRELKEDYNMVAYSSAISEWYVQSKAFSDWVVGKTAAELRGTETTTNEEGYQVAVDETLFSSVTISIEDMVEVVARAADYAR